MIGSEPQTALSIWGEVTRGEIALLIAGVVFTFALLGAFIIVMIRASREKR